MVDTQIAVKEKKYSMKDLTKFIESEMDGEL
jgi:hypothetical protein